MTEGIIIKALSGFYYVETAQGLISCKARGKFRLDEELEAGFLSGHSTAERCWENPVLFLRLCPFLCNWEEAGL